MMAPREGEAPEGPPARTRVLVVANETEESVLAARVALALSGRGAGDPEVHLACAALTAPRLPYPGRLPRERGDALREGRRLAALVALDEHARLIEAAGGRVAGSHCREGEPAEEIAGLGEEIAAGLTVVAEGGRGGGRKGGRLAGRLTETFAEALVRLSDGPVLVVHGRRGKGRGWR